MENKVRLKKGDKIKTTQYPWVGEVFLVEAIQEINPNRLLFCKNLKTNKYVNLVEPFCRLAQKAHPFINLSNIQIIRLIKAGAKGEALKEYVRRFKKMPKFK